MKIVFRNILISIVFLLPLFSCGRENYINEPSNNAPPTPPAGVRIFAAHDGAVGIEWDANQERTVAGYNLYRSVIPVAGFRKIGFTNSAYFIDSPLSYDSTYYYYVSAVRNDGTESSKSNTVNAKPINVYPPKSIIEIFVNGKNTGNSKYIRLFWTPQEEYDLKEYKIYRGTSPDFQISPEKLIAVSNFPYYEDYGILPLKEYFYKIIAVDKGDLESDYSPTVSDLVLESPVLIFPADKSTVKNLSKIQFKSPYPAGKYKIIIQSNELYGTVAEYDLFSSEIDKPITQIIDPRVLVSYKRYYWRVIAYSQSYSEPNSFSPLYSFTFIAE